MGEVYLAEDLKLERQVALKVLPDEYIAEPERRERFMREAKAIAALSHPNIVVIHSVEEDDDRVFLTMELVQGAPLSHLIAGGPMSLGQLFDTAIPLADAISAAHQKGIAHRDLKPDNVMVTPSGQVKVLDFGLAKLLQGGESELAGAATEMVTEEGKILGTVAYMSPEQAQGKVVDARSDIFSLGILLYEMATGRRPFEGDSKISILSSLVRDAPVPAIEVNRSLPRHLGRIIKHCLEKSPDRRYQSGRSTCPPASMCCPRPTRWPLLTYQPPLKDRYRAVPSACRHREWLANRPLRPDRKPPMPAVAGWCPPRRCSHSLRR